MIGNAQGPHSSFLSSLAPRSPPFAPVRISYLESIRGLAAIQVLLLHFFAAFVPDLVFPGHSSALAASIHLSPLSFLYDGYSAVYIFFTLSGYVLTRSFERQSMRPQLRIVARVVRLGLPALLATVVAAALMVLFGKANVEAGKWLGSDWLSRQWDTDLSTISIIRDGTVNALFLGYRDMPGAVFLAPWQQSTEQSFITPLWTLSIEFYGSMTILLLCWCAQRSRQLWLLVVLLGAVFTIRSAYLCFFAGHLLAVGYCAERPAPERASLPAALAAFGLLSCVVADIWQPDWLISLYSWPTPWLFAGQFPPMQQKAFGAVLFLVGIIHLQVCRDFLSKPWLVARSKLSFPLYLMHWPIMCGPAAALFLSLNKMAGTGFAQISALVSGIALAVAASKVFASVDRYAVEISARLRGHAIDNSGVRLDDRAEMAG